MPNLIAYELRQYKEGVIFYFKDKEMELTPSLLATLFKPTSAIALAITFLYSKLLASFGKSFNSDTSLLISDKISSNLS